MSRVCTETRDLSNWRDRLAKPESQWRRRYSAFETAVSWEVASRRPGGLPAPIDDLFRQSILGEAELLVAIAEHKVPLEGGRADSQCDVWALVESKSGLVSVSVEAKANESFGQENESLKDWLVAGKSDRSRANRKIRWDHIARYLPEA